VKICPAALNRRSNAALAARGVFISMSSLGGHAATVNVSIDGLFKLRYSCWIVALFNKEVHPNGQMPGHLVLPAAFQSDVA